VDVEELKREVAGIRWWHQIELGQGIVTPGKNCSRRASSSMPGNRELLR